MVQWAGAIVASAQRMDDMHSQLWFTLMFQVLSLPICFRPGPVRTKQICQNGVLIWLDIGMYPLKDIWTIAQPIVGAPTAIDLTVIDAPNC